ncbi:chloride channel protein [Dyella jiangningensis]|uniref:chloride channel protein n=1 Tax=Dyella jiangningensis TaxID=1379159 RepID=UPI00240F4AC2|nr:chloride channel protein [Dyella jiangningensis]MDG2536572.1 chloride channel protein [Dyella jiangningensis]
MSPGGETPEPSRPQARLRRLTESELFSLPQWRRRILFWTGAILVGLAAVGFAQAADWAYRVFHGVVESNRYWAFLITPLTFALLAWLTQGALKATRGSGIPQAIAALKVEDEGFRQSLLSLRVALGKMALTLAALLGGASVGREGPTVHVGAGLLYSLGRRFGFAEPAAAGRFILAGAAAGLAAAFNTPLAGIVFAIEEMSGSFEHRLSGILLTAVFVAGMVSLGILGNYAYFGQFDIGLPLGKAWWAVLATGLVCGLAGGLFARLILPSDHGIRGLVGRLRARQPVVFAASCGLALVLLSQLTHTGLYGTGYAQAREIMGGHADTVSSFGVLKFLGNVASYWAGIPGGIFSPALAVGAGLGNNLTAILPGVDPSAVALLAMAGYLSGVTQAPLTATVISMELTANQQMVLPIMATCLLARAASSILSRKPVYRALADKLIEGYERELARRAAEEQDDGPASATAKTPVAEDPATPIPPSVTPDEHRPTPSPGH